MTYAVHAAKTNLSRLIEAAEQGEEVIIARGNKPAVRLVPVEVPLQPRRQPDTMKGLFEVPDSFFAPLPDDELDAWNQ